MILNIGNYRDIACAYAEGYAHFLDLVRFMEDGEVVELNSKDLKFLAKAGDNLLNAKRVLGLTPVLPYNDLGFAFDCISFYKGRFLPFDMNSDTFKNGVFMAIRNFSKYTTRSNVAKITDAEAVDFENTCLVLQMLNHLGYEV